MPTETMMQLGTIAELKLQPVDGTVKIFVASKTFLGDGMGGMYYWDPSSTDTEDMIFLNYIKSALSANGRWIRMYQRSRNIAQGVLVSNGNVKTLYAPGVTNSAGTVTLSLSDKGAPIFSEIWENRSYCSAPANAPADAVQAYISGMAQDLSSTTHSYYRANAITVLAATVLGSLVNVGAGVKVQFVITGV